MAHTLIVGGTKGLGRVVLRLLAKRGDLVSVIGRSELSSEDRDSGNVDGYQADLSDLKSIETAVNQMVVKNGGINYCIFLQRYRGKENEWIGELETTLTATKSVVETILPVFSKEGDKALLMVSSVFSKYVGEGQSASYHVAKAGLDQLMRFYALNLGAKNIRSNGVTPFTFLKEESKKFYFDNPQIMKVYEDIIPLSRMATAEDSANAIEFLCSPKAGFITGQNITIDGGLSLVWPESMARKLMGV